MSSTKKPRGRPRKAPGERSAADINIRTTPATKAKLQAAAKVRKATLSAFVLAAAMKEAIPNLRSSEPPASRPPP